MSDDHATEQVTERACRDDRSALVELRDRSELLTRSLIEAELPEEFRKAEGEPSPIDDILLDVQCSLSDNPDSLGGQAGQLEDVFSARLIALVKQEVFLWLARRHERTVRKSIPSFLSHYLRGMDIEDEVWDDTVMTALRKYGEFVWLGEEAFADWLLEIARGQVRDRQKYETRQRRDHRRRVGVPGENSDSPRTEGLDGPWISGQTPSQSARRRERSEILLTVMAEELTAREQWALELCCFQCRTTEQAAGEMGISPSNVTTITHRAREKLRGALERRGVFPSSR